ARTTTPPAGTARCRAPPRMPPRRLRPSSCRSRTRPSAAPAAWAAPTAAGRPSCWAGPTAAGHFATACPNYITATGTTAWTLATLGTGALVSGHGYTVTVETIDNATNANTAASAATSTFVYDNTAPTAAVTFPASGTHYNS